MWQARSIMVPVTLDADSDSLVSVAASLAESLRAELVLAGIAPLTSAPRAAQVGELTLAPGGDQRLVDLLVHERLEELSAALPAGVRARSVLTWGPLSTALLGAAREERAELVVMGLRRIAGLGPELHGHADRYILHQSEVPVLVVPIEPRRPRLC
jgi:nucleotide-binding universal stress UspA family protein